MYVDSMLESVAFTLRLCFCSHFHFSQLSKGINFVQGAEKAAQSKSDKAPHFLSDKDGRDLAKYLQPQHKLAKGQAPGLGYAV